MASRAADDDDEEEEEGFQIILLGNSQVGKTCLVKRYSEAVYMDNKPTTGIECFKSCLPVRDNVYSFKIWDTAGEARFRTFATAFVETAQGFAICFDCTDRSSFKSVMDDWSMSLTAARPAHDFSLALVACKIDLRETMPAITEEEGRQKAADLAERLDIPVQYYEVSAKQNILCTDVFTELATAIVIDTLENDAGCTCTIL